MKKEDLRTLEYNVKTNDFFPNDGRVEVGSNGYEVIAEKVPFKLGLEFSQEIHKKFSVFNISGSDERKLINVKKAFKIYSAYYYSKH